MRVVTAEARLGLPFPRYVSRLRAMNACTAEALCISTS